MFVFPDLANHAAPRVWSWMKENWTTLDKKFGSGLGLLRSYVAMIVRALGEKEHLEDVEGFFEGIDTEAYRQKLEQGLDSLKAKIEWVQRDREDVKEWLFE
jgi:aminopeptidase 2